MSISKVHMKQGQLSFILSLLSSVLPFRNSSCPTVHARRGFIIRQSSSICYNILKRSTCTSCTFQQNLEHISCLQCFISSLLFSLLLLFFFFSPSTPPHIALGYTCPSLRSSYICVFFTFSLSFSPSLR